MSRGIPPRALGPMCSNWQAGGRQSIPFIIQQQTNSSDSTYNIYTTNHPPQRPFKIINAWGHMQAAGGAGDTIVIRNGTNAATNTVDLSIYSNTDLFDFGQLIENYCHIERSGTLNVFTASFPLCIIHMLCVYTDE